MRITEDIKPVTFMKMRSAELLRGVRKNRRPVVITQNGEPTAVVLDVDSYQSLRDASLMIRLIARSEEQITKGRTVPQSEVFDRMERRLAALRPKTADSSQKSGRKRRKRR
jgi:prevent-host-death family protein